jgi:predicted TIM-barrel fold metal-dependent hydrolase
MIVDAHVHIYDENSEALHQLPFTAEALLAQMDGPYDVIGEARRVDVSVAQPHPSDSMRVTDIAEQHRYVAESADRYPDRILGCMLFNPLLDIAQGLAVLKELVDCHGFCAVKVHPTMHGYFLDAATDRLAPVMRLAAELGLVVIVHTGDPPFAEPVQALALIEQFPQTTIVLAHLATQQVSYSHQAIYLARDHPNVCLEAGWGILPRIKDAVKIVGPDRVLHATDCPVQEMGSQLRLLDILRREAPIGISLADADAALLLGGNAMRLLGLPEPSATAVLS